MRASVGVHIHAHGLRNAWRSSAVRAFRRQHLLPPCSWRCIVRRRLPSDRPSTGPCPRRHHRRVRPLAPVGIDDYLAACQTGVAVRSADDELCPWGSHSTLCRRGTATAPSAVHLGEHARMRMFITSSLILASIRSSSESNSSCCVLTTMVSMRCGTPSSLYSTVTWLFESGAQIGHYLAFATYVGKHTHDELC